MMNSSKIEKDLQSLTDLVLMKEIRDTGVAIAVLQQKLQLMQQEVSKRIGVMEDKKELDSH